MQLRDLLKECQPLTVHGNPEFEVSGLSYDSRKVQSNSLFFCLRGGALDGHNFIDSAINQGAKAIVLEEMPKDPPAQICFIQVKDARLALAQLSAGFYKHPSAELTLVGITGTNGKTTLSYLLESIFSAAQKKPGVIGTINYRYHGSSQTAHNTTPESLELNTLMREMREHEVNTLVMEVSSHALEQSRVSSCRFDVAVLTNITQDHLDYHQNLANYIRAKAKLFAQLEAHGKGVKTAVINADDRNVAPILETLRRRQQAKLVTFGYSQVADMRPIEMVHRHDGFSARIFEKQSGESHEISAHLPGRHNLMNCLAAAATARALGVEWSMIQKGVGALKHVPGRLECLSTDRNVSIYIDYAHTEDALSNVLQAMRLIRSEGQGGRGRIITVFGCGGNRDVGKRPKMGEAAMSLSDLVIITSDNPRFEEPLKIIEEISAAPNVAAHLVPAAEFSRRAVASSNHPMAMIMPDRREAIQSALSAASNGDLILIAGKGHEDTQEIRGERYPFSDRRVCENQLTRLGWKIVSA